MANFDEFKKAAKETMGTIADRSVELYKIAEEKTKIIAKRTKLSAEIAVEKGGVRNLYKEIGKIYYELHKNDPELALRQLCAEVDSSWELIALKQQELDELKNAGYTAPPVDYEPPAEAETSAETAPEETTEDPFSPPVEDTDEAPQSGTYDAEPPQGDNAQTQDDWQKKYPPEFRL
jgi:hypothetical protein